MHDSNTMRSLMNLTEKQNLSEEEPMLGTFNSTMMLKMLPDITDKNLFSSAMNKVRAGQEKTLSPTEFKQLGLAFVSFLHSQPLDRTKFAQSIVSFVEKKPPQTVTPPQQTQSAPPTQPQNGEPTQ